MARVVRKVSKVNANGKKSFWKLTKKQTGILGGVIGAIVVAVVAVVLIVTLTNNTEEENKPDYFLNPGEVTTTEVKFNKSTYAGARNYAYGDDSLSVEHLFVFAYDSSIFYPVKDKFFDKDADDNDVDKYVKEQKELFDKLVELQLAIDEAAKKSPELAKEIKLVIIDTKACDGAGVLEAATEDKNTNTIKFVESETEEQFVFSYINDGSFKSKVKIGSTDKKISGTGITIKNDAIQCAINYVQQIVEDLSK